MTVSTPSVHAPGNTPADLPPLVEAVGSLTREETLRYSRHLIIPGFGVAGILMVAFVFIEGRATQPLVHPHTWRISSLCRAPRCCSASPDSSCPSCS